MQQEREGVVKDLVALGKPLEKGKLYLYERGKERSVSERAWVLSDQDGRG